jgi:2-alkyl-3-oxoalkanoate reductase
MRIFVAGASGAVGKRLIPRLVSAGHFVVATTRTPQKVDALRALGAAPMLLDGLDRNAVMKAVDASRPEVIVHEMTALASMRNFKRFDDEFALTNRLRTEGTENLLAAARTSGVRKVVVQSYTGWMNELGGSRIKTENDPLESHPPKAMTKSLDAVRTLESMVMGATGIVGIVLRYGSFYGPGTFIASDGEVVGMVRHRKLPLIGSGAGVWSFIHVDDAAEATQLAIENGAPGIYNIVDDDPAEVSAWLPELARAVDAKPPRHIPEWLGRLAIGDGGVRMMTAQRGSSNEKAKRMLRWQPTYASLRDGFRRGLVESPMQARKLSAAAR